MAQRLKSLMVGNSYEIISSQLISINFEQVQTNIFLCFKVILGFYFN